MNVIIIGSGRVGARLAARLSRNGHAVAVVDYSREAFVRLGPNFRGATYQGNGTEADVLRRAGASKADVVFALTGGDNRNVMIAQIVKHTFQIERVVARLKDPVRSCMYRQLGIETLCTTTLVEGLLEHYAEDGAFPPLPEAMPICGDADALTE